MITITIPDTVETAIRLPEKEVKKELLKLLAAKLYEKGIVGIGKAAELCGMSKLEFMQLLKEEKINLNYDEEELKRDLKNMEYFKW
ncbi:MAG TPA: UPF0175 family protein [Candidatus Atribacteria bacterium]|nr:UPF0175 family protein [Candidatus Atribacteria bacterium]